MPKFYHIPEDKLGIARPLNEDVWFQRYQKLLLWMANQKSGRDLLCIPKEYGQIIDISKRHVTFDNGFGQKISDFRVGAKWANVIRSRWVEFNEYAKYYEPKGWVFPWEMFQPVWAKSILGVPVLLNTVTTVFPDPDPETTTVDGLVFDNQPDATFANKRSAAGDGAQPSAASNNTPLLGSAGTTDQYAQIWRNVYLFDTSSIPDTDTISAATLSVFGTADKTDNFSQSATIVQSAPASNTNLVAGDYALANWTMTQQNNTDISIASWTINAYNDFDLNATGQGNVSKTGVSKFGMVFSGDRTNTAPAWSASLNAFIGTYFADQALTTNDPKLVVTHAAAAVGMNLMPLLGLG